MDKVQKHNSFNTNTPSSESYRNYLYVRCPFCDSYIRHGVLVFESIAIYRQYRQLFLYAYFVLYIIRVIRSRSVRLVVHVARIENMRNACKFSVGQPEGKRPLGKPICRWEDNIRMDLTEVVWQDVDWMHLVRDSDHWRAVVNTVINLRVP
jgi:hypothetical protein